MIVVRWCRVVRGVWQIEFHFMARRLEVFFNVYLKYFAPLGNRQLGFPLFSLKCIMQTLQLSCQSPGSQHHIPNGAVFLPVVVIQCDLCLWHWGRWAEWRISGGGFGLGA